MKYTKLFILLLFLSAILQSCSIEKRLYNKGFHVESNLSKKEKNSHYRNSVNSTEIQKYELEEFEYLTEIETNDYTVIPKRPKLPKKIDNCDIIILKNGKEISCKVIEANSKEVSYIFCGGESSYTQSILASEVKSIKYGGTTIKEEKTEEPDYYKPNNSSQTANNYSNAEEKQVYEWAIISFISGFLSFLIVFTFIPAIYFGRKALEFYRIHPEYKGKILAELGLIFGFVCLTIIILFFVLLIIFLTLI